MYYCLFIYVLLLLLLLVLYCYASARWRRWRLRPVPFTTGARDPSRCGSRVFGLDHDRGACGRSQHTHTLALTHTLSHTHILALTHTHRHTFSHWHTHTHAHTNTLTCVQTRARSWESVRQPPVARRSVFVGHTPTTPLERYGRSIKWAYIMLCILLCRGYITIRFTDMSPALGTTGI